MHDCATFLDLIKNVHVQKGTFFNLKYNVNVKLCLHLVIVINGHNGDWFTFSDLTSVQGLLMSLGCTYQESPSYLGPLFLYPVARASKSTIS